MKDTTDHKRTKSVAFVWDALAPQHVDKLNALVGMFKAVHGVQIYPKSRNYNWTWLPDAHFEAHAILKGPTGALGRILKVPLWCVRERFKRNISIWFLCNYEEPYTFLSAILLRLTGAKVYVVQNSKFDDYQRKLPLEMIKWILYRPYQGAIVSGERTRSYLRFLGVGGPIQFGYNTADTDRLQVFNQDPGPAFADRPFLCVGRLIPKKNISMLVAAYAEYCRRVTGKPRPLMIVGEGPEAESIRALATKLNVIDRITFQEWTDQPIVLKAMAESLYLLLPSLSEQFGNVVGEACCVGLPAIVSTNCGATDRLVWDFRSGFSVSATDTASWAQALLDVSDNEPLWRRLRDGARSAVPYFGLGAFQEGVAKLVDGEDIPEAAAISFEESYISRH